MYKLLNDISFIFKVLPVFILLFASCAGKQQTTIDTGQDEAKEAEGLEIYRVGDCRVARVLSPGDTTQVLGTYIFPDTDDTADIPEIEGAYIFPPSKRQNILLYTSVYATGLKELNSQGIIKAVGDSQYFTDKDIIEGLENGKIVDVGTIMEPVAEKIIAAKPDMILVSMYDGVDVSKLEKLGIPIVYLCESSETSPLGKAEWLKLLGLIAGNKEGADKIYDTVCKEYNLLKQKGISSNKKPKVMTETMYEGTWFVAGGKSYAAALIEDAGGQYIWSDDDTAGSLPKGFEEMLNRGADADIWLIKSFGKDLTLKDLETEDSRYMLFKPAKRGGVWNVNTQALPFFDETPFHPELILKDYIAIFHPENSKETQPHYFKSVK